MLALLAMMLSDSPTLSLRCIGTVVVTAQTGETNTAAQDSRGNAAAATSVMTGPIQATLETGFEMAGGNASVFLPVEMRPAFSRDKDGWFPVKDLAVANNSITGNVKMSFARSTAFKIDRNTGVLTTRNGYRADCTPVDRTVRKF